eukprot:365718-Chlamydomonas_euryale.AAC.22
MPVACCPKPTLPFTLRLPPNCCWLPPGGRCACNAAALLLCLARFASLSAAAGCRLACCSAAAAALSPRQGAAKKVLEQGRFSGFLLATTTCVAGRQRTMYRGHEEHDVDRHCAVFMVAASHAAAVQQHKVCAGSDMDSVPWSKAFIGRALAMW